MLKVKLFQFIVKMDSINPFPTANANMVHICTINVLYHHTFNILMNSFNSFCLMYLLDVYSNSCSIFFFKMMILINLNPLKHSYVHFFCELNFAPILEFAIFYHFRDICTEKSYIFSEIPNCLRSRMHVLLII